MLILNDSLESSYIGFRWTLNTDILVGKCTNISSSKKLFKCHIKVSTTVAQQINFRVIPAEFSKRLTPNISELMQFLNYTKGYVHKCNTNENFVVIIQRIYILVYSIFYFYEAIYERALAYH